MGIGRIGRVDPDHLHETRDDATRLAAPAAAGPTYRARRTAEGIASLAPHDAELQHERARAAGPDARAETRRPRRPIEVNTRAGEVASTATATPAAHSPQAPVYTPVLQGQHVAGTGRRLRRAKQKE